MSYDYQVTGNLVELFQAPEPRDSLIGQPRDSHETLPLLLAGSQEGQARDA